MKKNKQNDIQQRKTQLIEIKRIEDHGRHTEDPLKRFKISATRKTQHLSEKQYDENSTEGIFSRINAMSQQWLENEPKFDALQSSDTLNYKGPDIIKEGLSLLNSKKISANDIANEKQLIEKAKLVLRTIELPSSTLDSYQTNKFEFDSKLKAILPQFNKNTFLFNFVDTSNFKYTDTFKDFMHRDYSKLIDLKQRVGRGGSKKSRRNQKEIMTDTLEDSQNTLDIYDRMLYNLDFYILSNYIFLYQDTLALYKKKSVVLEKDKEYLITLIKAGFATKNPNKPAIDYEHLAEKIQDYSNKVEHASGFCYHLSLKPELNEWINQSDTSKILAAGDGIKKLVKKVLMCRKDLKVEEFSESEEEKKVKILQEGIDRRKHRAEFLEKQNVASETIGKIYEQILLQEAEISQMSQNRNRLKHELFCLEMELFKESIAYISQYPTDNKHDLPLTLMQWLNIDLTQVTRQYINEIGINVLLFY